MIFLINNKLAPVISVALSVIPSMKYHSNANRRFMFGLNNVLVVDISDK